MAKCGRPRTLDPETVKTNKREYNRRWRLENADRFREMVKNWRHRNPDKVREFDAKQRRKRRNVAGKHTEVEWRNLLQLCGSMCIYCGDTGVEITKDHVVPISQSGVDDIDNIVPCCRRCNSSKKDNDPTLWLMKIVERCSSATSGS